MSKLHQRSVAKRQRRFARAAQRKRREAADAKAELEQLSKRIAFYVRAGRVPDIIPREDVVLFRRHGIGLLKTLYSQQEAVLAATAFSLVGSSKTPEEVHNEAQARLGKTNPIFQLLARVLTRDQFKSAIVSTGDLTFSYAPGSNMLVNQRPVRKRDARSPGADEMT